MVKITIIKEIDYKEVLNMYSTIKDLNDYKEIVEEIKHNEKLKEKIHDIYTK